MAAPSLSDIANLRLYCHSEAGTSSASQWDDQSGNAYHLTQATAGQQPVLTQNVFGPGASVPGYRFTTAATSYWNIPGAATSGLTQATAMVAFRLDAWPGSGGGVWNLGNDAILNNDHTPWTDSLIYDQTGCSNNQRKTVGDPGVGIQPWVYAVTVNNNDFKAWRNGFQFFSNTTLTVAWKASPRLGNGNYQSINGYIAAFALWSRQLSAAEVLDASTRLRNWMFGSSTDLRRETERLLSPAGSRADTSGAGLYTPAQTISKSPYFGQRRGLTRRAEGDGLFRADHMRAAYQPSYRRPYSPQALPSAGSVVWYRMRAWDVNAGVERVWDVQTSPDYDASRYTGPFGGGSINFTQIFILLRYYK